jgi:hypothetical protein
VGGTATDVAGWLRGLGVGQYEDKFRDSKIDAELLPRLTGDDLKEIGVSALGDQLRLFDANRRHHLTHGYMNFPQSAKTVLSTK